jgi:pyruvate formate lyase activating enzyme
MSLPIIYGFNGSSDVGESTFGVSVFLAGCNLRCPYCMNSRLVLEKDLVPVDINEIKSFVRDNKREWVMISGGEPTLDKNLFNLIQEIRSWGCKVGLSTNGTNCDALRCVISSLDYVAMDIKTSRHELVYPDGFIDPIRSLSILVYESHNRPSFNYEIRSALYPPFVRENDIVNIGLLLPKDCKWVLQQFRLAKNRLEKNEVQPYSDEQVNELLKIAQNYVPRTSLSYV